MARLDTAACPALIGWLYADLVMKLLDITWHFISLTRRAWLDMPTSILEQLAKIQLGIIVRGLAASSEGLARVCEETEFIIVFILPTSARPSHYMLSALHR